MAILRVGLILFFSARVFAQEALPDARFIEQTFVTAIELAVRVTDRSGETPADLTPSDFLILENGVERPVIGVDYLAFPEGVGKPAPEARPQVWETVLWIDATTTSQATLREAAAQLAVHAADMTSLGPVTLVWANPAPEVVLASGRDAGALASNLAVLARRAPRNEIGRIRMNVLRASDDPVPSGSKLDSIARRARRVTGDVLVAVQQEVDVIRRSRRQIANWVGRRPGGPPRALLVVGDGFDLDPSDFYGEFLESIAGADARRYRGRFSSQSQVGEHHELARAVAVRGWTVIAIGGRGGTAFPDDASRSGGQRLTDFSDARTASAGAKPPSSLALHPRDPFLDLAEATGGDVIPHAGALEGILADLRNRVVITYQVPRAPDIEPRRIEVRALRADLSVTAPRWASSSPPAAIAEARAAALLEEDIAHGELPVSIRAELGRADEKGVRSGEIEATLDLATLAEIAGRLAATRVRVTIAVGGDDTLPIVVQSIIPADLSRQRQLRWSAPLNVEKEKNRIAVVFEELTTGTWGGAAASLAERRTPPELAGDPNLALPGGWLSGRDEALAAAAAEAKPVLAFAFHRDCGECLTVAKQSLVHPAVERKLGSFVRLLIDETLPNEGSKPQDRSPTSAVRLSGLDRRAYFLILDLDGREHFRLSLSGDAGAVVATAELSEFLGRMEEVAPLLVEGAALAREGKLFDSTRAFGLAYRRAAATKAAVNTFERMHALARAGGDRHATQTAEVLLGLTLIQAGDLGQALRHFESVARDPASPANHAEALLGIGQVRRSRGDEKGATEAFVKAARLAPEGSEILQAAMMLAGAASDVVHGAVALTPENSIKPLQLAVPGRPPFSGKVEVQGLVRDPRIDRVTFSLDDAEAAVDDTPPFTARLDLGDLPRARRLRITAFDSDGQFVAEDMLVVNERHDHFWIDLVVDGDRAHVEAAQPLGRRVEKIDFFLDGRWFETISASPWRISVPPMRESSVLRAVARLDDGTLAEDVALLNPQGYLETMEVHEVELYVTALHRGKPVRDLTVSELTVTENGDRKTILGFEFLDGAPWTAGIAMDSSGSMNAVMPDVQEAVRDFAGRTIDNGGRAFIVDFDGAPRLAHPTSADFAAIGAAIDRITAGGGTALYDAIVFGLLQLQGIEGKRALVVLTDGEDRTSRYDYTEAIHVARESGATVYAIVLDEHGSMDSPHTVRLRRELETLARVTGGEAWYLRNRREIADAYDAIDHELRNQYVLTYRTEPASEPNDWRTIRVRAGRRGVRVKSIEGYLVK